MELIAYCQVCLLVSLAEYSGQALASSGVDYPTETAFTRNWVPANLRM